MTDTDKYIYAQGRISADERKIGRMGIGDYDKGLIGKFPPMNPAPISEDETTIGMLVSAREKLNYLLGVADIKKLSTGVHQLVVPVLSAGDLSFVNSLNAQLNKKGRLSPSQLDWVDRLLKKYSPENIESGKTARAKWTESFDEEKKKNLRICVEYYEETGTYFSSIVRDYRNNKDYMPTESTYRKLCLNKYAQKVINEHDKEPSFGEGEMVSVRKAYSSTHTGYASKYQAGRGRVASNIENVLIIQVLDKIVSSAKGAKQYLCLPVGQTQTRTIEERHLKKIRKGKKK